MSGTGVLDRLRREWPTWVVLTGCYLIWTGAVIGHNSLGWAWILVAIPMVTLHSSLQHEILHGHPTASAKLNEALVFPAIGLFIPYRRFRDLHLRHHDNARLTDPYDDPESWYRAEADWARSSAWTRLLLRVNATLAGRMAVGPALAIVALASNDWKLAREGHQDVRSAWLLHVLGAAPVLGLLLAAGINPLLYAIAVAYPGLSLLMVRTFIEHRAAERVPERTAVVEAGPLMSLLFLNNNLHAVHHQYPCVAWHRLPDLWRRERTHLLSENAHYHFPGGYVEVMRAWLFHRREPLVHPFLRRSDDTGTRAMPGGESRAAE